MPAIISKVEKNSIADELGFERGDKILSINGDELKDLIDYRFSVSCDYLEIALEKANGQLEEYEIEKDFDEDLGIVFESAVFDKIKACTNRCIFCFVDQQPEGLRESLYVKDDDYRLSYLQGTYITLTNLTKSDKERIEKLRLGPLYISVHTTNPELRIKMLNNPKARNILEELKWIKSIDIPLHLQIVLCPGFNDGKELERTLNDLKSVKSVIESIAVVPVGITKFQKNDLTHLTKKVAEETIDIIDKFNTEMKKSIAQASDEFFLKAEKEIPPAKYYGKFAQLEDGVGSIRLLLDDFEKRKKKLPQKLNAPKSITFATSSSASYPIKKIVEELNKVENLKCDFVELKNIFFGTDVTVAGLITGQDLIKQLKDKKIENLIIPSVMLRSFTNDFLDGTLLSEVERKLNCKITVIKDVHSTKEIFGLL